MLHVQFKLATTLFDRLICDRTDSPFCHVELAFDDHTGFTALPDYGVRIFDNRDYSTPIWSALPVFSWLPDADAICRAKAEQLASQHMGYDWLAILGFLVPAGEHERHDMICSEAVLTALQAVGDPRLASYQPWLVSPGKLYEILKDFGPPVLTDQSGGELLKPTAAPFN